MHAQSILHAPSTNRFGCLQERWRWEASVVVVTPSMIELSEQMQEWCKKTTKAIEWVHDMKSCLSDFPADGQAFQRFRWTLLRRPAGSFLEGHSATKNRSKPHTFSVFKFTAKPFFRGQIGFSRFQCVIFTVFTVWVGNWFHAVQGFHVAISLQNFFQLGPPLVTCSCFWSRNVVYTSRSPNIEPQNCLCTHEMNHVCKGIDIHIFIYIHVCRCIFIFKYKFICACFLLHTIYLYKHIYLIHEATIMWKLENPDHRQSLMAWFRVDLEMWQFDTCWTVKIAITQKWSKHHCQPKAKSFLNMNFCNFPWAMDQWFTFLPGGSVFFTVAGRCIPCSAKLFLEVQRDWQAPSLK